MVGLTVLSQAGLKVAPSLYYAAKNRPASARSQRDAVLAPALVGLWEDNYQGLRRPQAVEGRAVPATTPGVTRSPG